MLYSTPSTDRNEVLSFATKMLCRDEQPTKAHPTISVTLLGISMFCNDVQPLKALSPIFVTLLGMSMLRNDEQQLYLQPVITQYFASNKSEIWS